MTHPLDEDWLDDSLDELSSMEEGFPDEALAQSLSSIGQEEGSTPARALSRPVPGRFYKIQAGRGGLLQTAARAYGVPLQPNPLTLAQLINDHPYNRRFWRAPENAWERTHFPNGIITFNPRFACDVRAQQATAPGQRAPGGRCLATLWIPPATYWVHPLLGRATPIPLGAIGLSGRETATAPAGGITHLLPRAQALAFLRGMCGPNPKPLAIHRPDLRQLVPNTVHPPYRWICSLSPIFLDLNNSNIFQTLPAVTGVMIGRNHVLTAAHAVQSLYRIVNASTGLVVGQATHRAIGAIISPGRNGVPGAPAGINTRALPFGELLTEFPASSTRLRIPSQWVSSLSLPPGASQTRFDPRFDFALIRFSPVDRVDARIPLPPGFWGSAITGGRSAVRTFIDEPAQGLAPDMQVFTCGYPEDKRCEQWESRGFVSSVEARVVRYEGDVVRGNSGGPVWLQRPAVNRGKVVGERLHLIGLQSMYERYSSGEVLGVAVRLRDAWPTLSRWLAEDNLRRIRR